MNWKDSLVKGIELNNVKKIRKQEYYYKSLNKNLVEGYLKENWEIDKEFKYKTRMKKIKAFDEIFENDVWMLFYNLGFKMMNKDRSFSIPYNKEENLTQQIDVFAADDETVILIECKATEIINKKQDFKTEIEALKGKSEGMITAIRKQFPEHKIKIIFSTKNYNKSPTKKQVEM